MPKRRKDTCEKLERKIKKLEKRLEQFEPSDSDSESPTEAPAAPSPTPAEIEIEGKTLDEIGDDTASVEELDDTILAALGSTQDTEKVYGDDVHKEIVKRVEGILVNGLKKESLEEIQKKYNIPKNATLLDAPKLNVELQGLLNDQIKARDKKVEERQQLIGVALAAVMNMINDFIDHKENSLKSITTLTDVSRLLAEVHFQETTIRRKLIGPSLDQKIAKSLENVKRDEHLFEKFCENIKTANAIKKSATTILKPIGQNTAEKSKKEYYRAPPRNSQFRYGRGGGRNQQLGTQHAPNQAYQPRQQTQPQKYYQRKRHVPQT